MHNNCQDSVKTGVSRLGTMALLYHDEVVSGDVFWIPALTAVKCTQQKQQYEFHTKKKKNGVDFIPKRYDHHTSR